MDGWMDGWMDVKWCGLERMGVVTSSETTPGGKKGRGGVRKQKAIDAETQSLSRFNHQQVTKICAAKEVCASEIQKEDEDKGNADTTLNRIGKNGLEEEWSVRACVLFI